MVHPHDGESTSPVDIQDAVTPMSVRTWSHGGSEKKAVTKKNKFVMEGHEKADELVKEDADAEGGNMAEARAQTVRLLRTRSVCSNQVRGALSLVRNLKSGNTEVTWFHQSPRSITLCKSKEEEGNTGWKLL